MNTYNSISKGLDFWATLKEAQPRIQLEDPAVKGLLLSRCFVEMHIGELFALIALLDIYTDEHPETRVLRDELARMAEGPAAHLFQLLGSPPHLLKEVK